MTHWIIFQTKNLDKSLLGNYFFFGLVELSICCVCEHVRILGLASYFTYALLRSNPFILHQPTF